MNRNSAIVWGVVALAAMVAPGLGPHQDWELRRGGDWDTLCMTIKRFAPGHGKWASTFNVPYSRIHGLPKDTIDRGGMARFEYVQDEGKLVCQGGFSWGKGEGSFAFVPNPQFRPSLTELGYDKPNDELLFSMMMSGVSLEFARELRDAGLTASAQQLADLQTQGVTLDFIRDVRREGYNGFSAQDYVDLHNQGIGAGFLRNLKDAGYNLSAKDILNLHAQGVDAELLRQLKNYGLQPGSAELVQLRVHGVTARFLDKLKAAGYEGLSADEIVSLHAQGVSPDFIQASRDLGYRFSTKELAELRNNGVDAGYLRRLQGSGMRSLSADDIAKLKRNGVD